MEQKAQLSKPKHIECHISHKDGQQGALEPACEEHCGQHRAV